MSARSERAARRWLILAAIFLTALLIALIVYLLLYLGRAERLVSHETRAGLQPIWEVYGPGQGETPAFDRPMGVAVGLRDRIYVTDAGNNRVCVFDPGGRFLFTFGTFGVAKPLAGAKSTYKPGRLNYPLGVDTDEDGNVYVASFGNDSIEVFDADGEALRRFPDPMVRVGRGASGTGGVGIAVTDVAAHNGLVYALDTYQVVVFTTDGAYVGQWGRPGSGAGSLDHPNGIEVGPDGTVYVADSNNARVTAYTAEGRMLWSLGARAQGTRDVSKRPFQLPRGLALSRREQLYVVDAFAFSLVEVSTEGTITASYGERGVQPGQFNFPNDIAVLRDSLVVVDRENGRVQRVEIARRTAR
jgi:outer membrane protein assembly factor BamB